MFISVKLQGGRPGFAAFGSACHWLWYKYAQLATCRYNVADVGAGKICVQEVHPRGHCPCVGIVTGAEFLFSLTCMASQPC